MAAPNAKDKNQSIVRLTLANYVLTIALSAAIVLALVTAFLYALSNVLELTEAEQVADEYALRPGLMVRLVQRPRPWGDRQRPSTAVEPGSADG